MQGAGERPLVFIFGQHRSGTTILYNALAAAGPFAYPGPFHIAHFAEYLRNGNFDRRAALAAMERRFAHEGISHRFVDDIPATPLTPEEYGFALPGGRLNAKTIGQFRDYCRFVGEGAPAGNRLLFKNPRDFGNIDFIRRNFPGAKLIFLHRHPGPVIASRLRELHALFRSYSPYQAVIEPGYARMGGFLRSVIGGVLSFESAVTFYLLSEFRWNAAHSLRAMATLPSESLISITYETLCAEPVRVLGDLLRFLGLPEEDAKIGAQGIAARPPKHEPNAVLDSRWTERQLKPYLDACGYRGLWPDQPST